MGKWRAFRFRLRLRPRRMVDLAIAVIILLILAGAVLALNYWLADVSRPRTGRTEIGRIGDVVGIVQLFVTALIIAVGGFFAYLKLQLFRDFEPHLTVTQSVSHRRIGRQFMHVAVTATLHNNSRVKVDVDKGYISLLQISPIDDEIVTQKYAEVFGDIDNDSVKHFQWVELDTIRRASGDDPLVIEPGESHIELGEFIVSDAVEAVLAYSYFHNSRYTIGSASAPGWTASTVYDIVVRK